MNEPLTGRAAVEALQFYTDAASADARFDSRRVADAIRTRHGRRSLRMALVVTVARLRLIRPLAARTSRSPRTRTRRRTSRTAALSPGRPTRVA